MFFRAVRLKRRFQRLESSKNATVFSTVRVFFRHCVKANKCAALVPPLEGWSWAAPSFATILVYGVDSSVEFDQQVCEQEQHQGGDAETSPPLAKNSSPSCLLRQQGNGIYVFTLVETGFEDGILYKIAEAEQLEGTELMVVAQA